MTETAKQLARTVSAQATNDPVQGDGSGTTDRFHRYRFPLIGPAAGDSFDPQPSARHASINHFQLMRTVVRRVRQRHLERHRNAEQTGFAEGQQRGYRDGYAEGRSAGLREAQQKQEQDAVQWLALINNLWDEVNNLHKSTLLNLGQPLVDLVTTVAQQVVSHELATSRESLQHLVADSLAMLPGTKNVALVINPADRPLIEPMVKELPNSWSIREEASLTRGGCRLFTDQGDIDATVESRLAACIDPLHEQLVPG